MPPSNLEKRMGESELLHKTRRELLAALFILNDCEKVIAEA